MPRLHPRGLRGYPRRVDAGSPVRAPCGEWASARSRSGISRRTRALQPGQRSEDTVAELLKLIQSSLDDDKAEEIVTIDLGGKTSLADHLVIASGRSTRQVAALTQKLSERIKQAGYEPPRVEGLSQADWVVVDTGDVIVHLFRPEVREFYNLEKLWMVTAAEADGSKAAAH